MKKITLIAFLMLSVCVNAQNTFAIYTEDPTIEAGVNSLRFSNGQGFAQTESTTAPYEGTKSYLFTFNGTSSYYHAIMFPRNAANTSDASVNLSAFSYYNVAIKTSSAAPFYIRMRGGASVTAKVLIDATAGSYGFNNDNQWHFLSIPIADFVPESAAFSLTNITEIFVLRSNITGSTAGLPNDFAVDNIYASVEQVMSVKDDKLLTFSISPNPTNDNIVITSAQAIDAISIYNILGQKVMASNPKNSTAPISVSKLQAGVYLVNIESAGKTATRRLIKK